jgi:hypothetical protein
VVAAANVVVLLPAQLPAQILQFIFDPLHLSLDALVVTAVISGFLSGPMPTFSSERRIEEFMNINMQPLKVVDVHIGELSEDSSDEGVAAGELYL